MSGWAKSCAARLPDTLAFLQELVAVDSPSRDPIALAEAQNVVGRWFQKIGATVRTHPDPQHGPTLEITVGEGARTVLLVGHIDTVWPVGETTRRPFLVSDGLAYGPGVCDMKSGIAIAWSALAAARESGGLVDRQAVLIVNPDEEIGSPSSRGLILETGLSSVAALVLEPAGPRGAVKARRRGVSRYCIRTWGKSAHGSDPASGINAIVELAHQLVRLSHQPAEPTWSMSVGTVKGGERVNVVPDQAQAEIDVRVDNLDTQARVDALFQGLSPVLSGSRVEVDIRRGHPPFESTPQNQRLLAHASAIARQHGIELEQCTAGGASDGNYLSGAGVPTLDGLGAIGGGAHALDEYVVVDSLAPRAALVGMLIAGL